MVGWLFLQNPLSANFWIDWMRPKTTCHSPRFDMSFRSDRRSSGDGRYGGGNSSGEGRSYGAVVLVLADPGVVVQAMDVLAVAPRGPRSGSGGRRFVEDDRIRTVALTAMVLQAARVDFPVMTALSVAQSRAVGVGLIASIASLQRCGAAVSRGKAVLRDKADSKAKAVSRPRGVMSPKAVLMVETAWNAGIAPRSVESASVVIASNGRGPGSVGAPIAAVHPVRNVPVQAVMTFGSRRVAGTGTRPVRPLNGSTPGRGVIPYP